ncbi:MAG: hypothetical protein CGW95_05845 [Phenylobacterium zucineum]|nr:MAG: hypothetical protein CGW95_05845 [Phenylobacterium zucineum]
MNTPKLTLHCVSSRKVLVLALMAAFGTAYADEGLDKLIKPDGATFSAGVAGVMGSVKDRSLVGQYNGWGSKDNVGLIDIEAVSREDATGTWTAVEGRNLGLDTREMRFSRDVQGQWKVYGEYNELVRHEPLTVNTGMQNVGTTTPTVSLIALGAGSDVNLDLKRKDLTLGVVKWLSPNLTIEANVKSEDKTGTRLSGIGGYCSNAISPICTGATSTVAAMFLLPEPVNSITQQIEGEIHYFDDKFSLTGGYYGSYYKNSNSTVALGGIGSVLAGTTQALLAANLGQPLVLPPDNQAHQLYLSGAYAFDPGTRANFKLAFTHATQDESFGSLAAGNLGGAVDTTLAQLGLTKRQSRDLTFNLNGRYEEITDRTRLGSYVVDSSGTLYTNTPNGSMRMNGKAEALYQFSADTRGAIAVDFASVNRERPVSTTFVPSSSLAAMRERTNEVGARVELRRSMSDTLNGAISLGHSDRDGYRWYSLNQATGYAVMTYAATSSLAGTFPMNMVDRSRDNFKLSADWTPAEALSIQASVDQGRDHFKGPTTAGLNDTDAIAFNVDAAYKLSDQWGLTAYASSGKHTLAMRQAIGYIANLTSNSSGYGLGVTGKVNSNLEFGASYSYQEDINSSRFTMTTGAAVINPPPDETYRITALKLYGKYALDKATLVQVDLIQQQTTLEDWNWSSGGVPFAYEDKSTVSIQPVQQVTYLGVKYVFRFK